jgi:hypothetical protein
VGTPQVRSAVVERKLSCRLLLGFKVPATRVGARGAAWPWESYPPRPRWGVSEDPVAIPQVRSAVVERKLSYRLLLGFKVPAARVGARGAAWPWESYPPRPR